MTHGSASRPEVRPILDADRAQVGQFLHEHLNERVGAADWARFMAVPWHIDAPNHGFMLTEQGKVVGAYLAFYSERAIEGRTERFCNLGAWCVLPHQRFHSLRLLNALLAQPGYHFTDLSPSGNTIPVNQRLKFRFLDTTTALMLNLPWISWPGRTVISNDPAFIEQTLSGRDAELYRDHAGTVAHHLVLVRGDERCYVIFRKDRRKGVPVFASLLHVSNPALLRAMARSLGAYLLLHYGVIATLAELRIVGERPWLAIMLKSNRRKMFRSANLEASHIDYLYSELVCVAW